MDAIAQRPQARDVLGEYTTEVETQSAEKQSWFSELMQQIGDGLAWIADAITNTRYGDMTGDIMRLGNELAEVEKELRAKMSARSVYEVNIARALAEVTQNQEAIDGMDGEVDELSNQVAELYAEIADLRIQNIS